VHSTAYKTKVMECDLRGNTKEKQKRERGERAIPKRGFPPKERPAPRDRARKLKHNRRVPGDFREEGSIVRAGQVPKGNKLERVIRQQPPAHRERKKRMRDNRKGGGGRKCWGNSKKMGRVFLVDLEA